MRCVKFAIVLSLAAAWLATRCAAEQIHSEVKDSRYWFRTIILRPDQMRVDALTSISKRFLQEAMPNRYLVALSAFTSAEEAAMATSVNRGSYRQWYVYYEHAVKRPAPAAEMIGIHGNAAMLLRTVDGNVTRVVVAGKDPLRFRVAGTDFEILLAQPRRTTRFDGCSPGDSLSPSLYLSTRASLTTLACERASKYIGRLLQHGQFHAHFRNDHWFISFGGYPVLDLFALKEQPPSEQEYSGSVSFTCGKSCKSPMSCTQTMGFNSNDVPGKPVSQGGDLKRSYTQDVLKNCFT